MSEEKKKEERKGGCGCLLFKGCLALIVLLLILVGAIPSILSTVAVRSAIMDKVGDAVDGEISIAAWSLSWFGAQRVDGIAFKDRAETVDIRIKQVVIDSGLISLARGKGRLGSILIDEPALTFNAAMATSAPKEPAPAPKPTPRPGPKPSTPGDAKASAEPVNVKDLETRLIEQMQQAVARLREADLDPHGSLKVRNGSITVKKLPNLPDQGIEKLDLELTVAGLDTLMKAEVKAAFRDSEQNINFHLHLDPSAKTLKKMICGGSDIAIQGLELAMLTPFVTAPDTLTGLNGKVDLALDAHIEGLEDLHCTAELKMRDVTLEGPLFQGDRPALASLDFSAKLSVTNNTLTVKQLSCASPLLGFDMEGALDMREQTGYPNGAITLNARLLLPELARQFRNTLALQEGLFVEQGALMVSAKIDSQPDKLSATGRVRTQDIKARSGELTLSLNQPLMLTVSGSLDQAGPKLEQLNLFSSFATIKGAGNLDDFGLEVEADLAKALEEAVKFVDLKGLRLTGAVQSSLHIKSAADGARQANLEASVNNLSCAGLTPAPIKQDAVQVSFDGLLHLTEQQSLDKISHIVVRCVTDELNVKAGIPNLALSADQQPESADIQYLSIQADLAKLSTLLNSMKALPEDTDMAGSCVLNGKGSYRQGVLRLPNLIVALEKFRCRLAIQQLAGLDLRFKSRLTADRNKRLALLEDALLVTPAGKIELSVLSLSDWLQPMDGITLKAETALDLEKLDAMLADFSPFPTNKVAGSALLKADVATRKGIVEYNLDGQVTDLLIGSQAAPMLDEKQMDLGVKGRYTVASADLHLDQLNLTSTPLTLDCTGRLGQLGQKNTIDLKGNLAMDLEKLDVMLGDYSPFSTNKVAGSVVMQADVATREGVVAVNLDGQVKNLLVASGPTPVWEEKEIDLGLKGRYAMERTDLQLEKLTLTSTPLTLDCTGRLNDLGQNKNIDLKGNLALDFERIGRLLKSASGMEIEMAGRQPRDFYLKASLRDPSLNAVLRNLEADAELYLERLKAFGLETGELKPHFKAADSQLRIWFETTLNQGDFAFDGRVDASGDVPVFSMPPNLTVLTNFPMTDDLANELLGRIHPVFQHSTIVGGTIDKHMLQCSLPLDATWEERLTIQSTVQLHDIVMIPEGILLTILETARIRDREFKVPNQTLSYTIQNGWIMPTPLTLRAKGHDLIFSGSVSLNGEMNYVAEVPVTEDMVGRDLYQHVKGATIKILITGHVSKPRISKDSFEATLRGLIKESGKKALMDKGVNELFKILGK